MVIGDTPVEKLPTCCGTLSSRIRKLPLGILGMKLPRLSTTATSTLTERTSAVKVGTPAGSSPAFFLGNCEGILGWSGSGTGAAFPDFFGRVTVSLPRELGPCCAEPSGHSETRAIAQKYFMVALYQIRRR